MGGEIAGDRDQNVAPFVALAPFPILSHAGFEHLVGVEVGILAQDSVRQRGDQPIGRMAEPAEVASLALFLCSEEASFITGVAIPIDGGYTAL